MHNTVTYHYGGYSLLFIRTAFHSCQISGILQARLSNYVPPDVFVVCSTFVSESEIVLLLQSTVL